MRNTRHLRKSFLSRMIVTAVSILIMISCIPDEILTAYGAEHHTENTTEKNSDDLKYRTIRTSLGDAGDEIITLNGMMPADAEVSINSSEEYSTENLCAYDISITDNSGAEFQPETDSPIRVKMQNPAISEAVSQEQNLRLWHIDDNGIREEIKDFRIKNDTVIFDAEGFSVYEIDNGNPPLRTYHFQMPTDPADNSEYKDYFFQTSGPDDSSYKMICQQIIKNGEKPIFPQLPAHTLRNYTFVGWFVYNTSADTLSEEPFDFDNIAEVTQNEEVILRAVFKSCVYAIFYDQFDGKTEKFPVMATKQGALVHSSEFGNVRDVYGHQTEFLTKISLGDLLINYEDEDQAEGEPPGMLFEGWAVVPEQSSNYNDPSGGSQHDTSLMPSVIKEKIDNGTLDVIKDKEIYISETTRLYPVFEPIRWLVFNTNQDSDGENPNTYHGATYKPPVYFKSDKGFSFSDAVASTDGTPVSHTPPVLAGYSFDGWFTGDGIRVTNPDLSPAIPQNAVPDANGVIHINDKIGINSENRFVFIDITGQRKTAQVNLYAHWTPSASKYTVIIWKEKATDAPDLAPEDKEWDFERSIIVDQNVMTNDAVSVADEYKNYAGSQITVNENGEDYTYDFTGFSYDTERNALEPNQVNVRSDGKTVLNVYYKRNKHTLTFKFTNSSQEIIEALYGANIYNHFPIRGNNNIIWNDSGNPKYYNYVLATIETMPDIDVTFSAENRNAEKTIYYCVEIDADDAGEYEWTRVFNGSLFGLYKTVIHGFNYLTYDEEYHPLEGYSRNREWAEPKFGTGNNNNADVASIGDGKINYLYYKRNAYIAEFIDSFNNTTIADRTVLYRQKLNSFVPEIPSAPEGHEFSGWYADSSCSIPIAFTDEDYAKYSAIKEQKEAEGSNYQFQDYRRMPANNIRVYAGWSTKWFKIEIDPNGGQLLDTQATWFWEPWNGEPIEEYKTTSRNYEPDVNGEYYYALRNRKYYGLGDEWDPREDTTFSTRIENGHCTRGAFYTTDISLATSDKRYREAENAYKYIGWYSVDPVTGEEEPYNFGTKVLHDTYLKLHWKQLGYFYIDYNAGEGTIDKTNENEVAFTFLDADDYADHADIVVTRVANPPEGKNFVGWKIRNDASDRIYYPNQSFIFSSSYAVSSSEIVNGQIETKRTIYLDAVYKDIDNAKIIYDPNGGEIDETAILPENAGSQNYELSPIIQHSEHPLTTNYSISGSKLIVGDIMNNSAVTLSNGKGFTNSGYDFVGWSTTPNGEDGIFFDAGSICYADNNKPYVLYAQWAVRVYFDRNNDNVPVSSTGWSGEWSENPNPDLIYDAEREQYYTTIIVGSHVNKPSYDLISDDGEEMFKYWSQTKQSLIGVMEQPFDFSSAVTETMIDSQNVTYTNAAGEEKKCFILYGCWSAPIKIPVHIVDTTNSTWVKRDDWLKEGVSHITIRNSVISLSATADAEEYADSSKVAGMEFAFACKSGNDADGYLNISEDNKISSIWYDTEDMKVKVRYADNSVHELSTSSASPEAVYLVYYKCPEDVPVDYMIMSIEGSLRDVPREGSHLDSAPQMADVSGTGYSMQENITRPVYWAKSSSYDPKYYSYAIGSENADKASDLRIITNFAESDSNRPSLYIRINWNGYEYSFDGSVWNSIGYDLQLYTIYYEYRPTIVDLTEKTIGMPEDMSEEFEYSVRIVQTKTQRVKRTFYYKFGNSFTTITQNPYKSTTNDSTENTELLSDNYTLSDNDIESFVLFYSTPSKYETPRELYQINGVTQKYHGYDVYYIDEVSNIVIRQSMEIIQTPKTGFLTENDSPVGDNEYNASYTSSGTSAPLTITYINTHQLKNQVHLALLRGSSLVQNDALRTTDAGIYEYTFSSEGDTWDISAVNADTFITDNSGKYVFIGTISGTEDSAQNINMKYDSVSSLTFGELDNDTYGYYLNGDNTKLLGDDRVYLVYLERPTIKYMFENQKTNELIPISPLEKNGTAFTRNSVPISQNEVIPVQGNTEELLLSQISTPGAPAFIIPDMLDFNGYHSRLDLAEIAVKTADGSLDRSDSETIYLNYSDGKLNYHFTEYDNKKSFMDDTTVYAIYKIKGYTLSLSKTVKGDRTDGVSDYNFTIHSDDMPDGEYYISGYGDADTVTCTGNNITLTMQHGSNVTIYGLPQGDYTITESAEGIYCMNVKVNNAETNVRHKKAAFHIDKDTTVDVFNVYPVPVTGAVNAAAPYIAILVFLVTAMAVLRILRRKEVGFNDNPPI